MAKRYRCNQCGARFVSDKPHCLQCDIDAIADPRAAAAIQPICTIHFDPPHAKVRHRGLGHPACKPERSVLGLRATGEPSVVNCEACRATSVWQQAAQGDVEFLGTEDEEVQLVREVVQTSAPAAAQGVTAEGDCGCTDKKGG